MTTQVPHSRLPRNLGAGTHPEAYEGMHVRDDELRVAVKVASPSRAQAPRFVDALKRECQELDRMNHGNLIRFRELVVHDGGAAMVLELLRGQDLHDRLAAGPLPVDTAVPVVEAILAGLGHAHAAGVLHRDIRPGNVYWCDDGCIVILDFGTARAADGTQATTTGQMVGTFDYMAPERMSGSGGTASSDVYAVGLIAWELLAGRPACPEGEVARKRMWNGGEGAGDAASIAAALPGCPTWFAEVIATLAAKDPAARPADGSAALALLREKRAGAGAAPSDTAAGRRPPPLTAMGPAPVPTPSAPPPSPGRSAPPGTSEGGVPRAVAAGGAGDAPPAEQGRLHERVHTAEPSSEPPPEDGHMNTIIVARVLAVVAWWCCAELTWTLPDTGPGNSIWGAGYQIPLVGVCAALGWHTFVRLAGVQSAAGPWRVHLAALSACLFGIAAGSFRLGRL